MLCGTAASAILSFTFSVFRNGQEMVQHIHSFLLKKIYLQLICRGTVPSVDVSLNSQIAPQGTSATVKNWKILHLTHGLPHIPVASPVADLSNQNVAMTVFSSVTQVLAHLAPRLSVCHVIVALQLPWFGGAVLRNGRVEIRVENYYCVVTITVRLHVTQGSVCRVPRRACRAVCVENFRVKGLVPVLSGNVRRFATKSCYAAITDASKSVIQTSVGIVLVQEKGNVLVDKQLFHFLVLKIYPPVAALVTRN